MAHAANSNKPPLSVFLATTFVLFFCTLSAADSVGFVPCQIDGTCAPRVTLSDLPELGEEQTMVFTAPAMPTSEPIEQAPVVSVFPKHIRISAIDLDLPIQNTTATDFAALDILLQKSPVRHALSGKLGESRNMIIFGHSSHLPVIHNQMYKAFNRVPELVAGDSIEIDGEDGITYLYSVIRVEQEDEKNFKENLLGSPDKKLYIVTCDTLTGKSARYILEAELIGTL